MKSILLTFILCLFSIPFASFHAIQTDHAPDDSTGWSAVVNGLQARVSFAQTGARNEKRQILTYLELRRVQNKENDNTGMTVVDLPFPTTFQFEVVDQTGEKVVPSYDPLRDPIDMAFPVVGTLRMPYDGYLRFPISRLGSTMSKDSGAVLNLCDLVDGPVWKFRPADNHPYDLLGRFSIEKAEDQKRTRWWGTIEIPKVRIPTTVD